MVLSDSAILQELEAGNIILDPFNPAHMNPNSVDLTLNPLCKTYKREVKHVDWLYEVPAGINCKVRSAGGKEYYEYEEALDCRRKYNDADVHQFAIPDAGFVLQPNKVYLYHTNERIGVKKGLCARVEGKSSLGRLGLFIHVTAGWIDAGFEGSLVLELHCVEPIRIYPNQKIAQICFMAVHGTVQEAYGDKASSKYMNQEGVQISKMAENWQHPNEEEK